MQEPVDPIRFGARVRELRKELGWSQGRLGKEAGFSQSNIGWIEQGKGQDPKKQVIALADALKTTPEWLLYGRGQRQVGIRPLTRAQLNAIYDDLPLAVQMLITDAVESGGRTTKKRTSR